jgi:hypothetical protein
LAVHPPEAGTTSNGATVPCENYFTVEAFPDTCYNFINWTVDNIEVSDSMQYTFLVTGHREFVANFEIKTFDVELSANPAVGGNAASGGGIDIDCGEITITATEDECYTFVNWTDQNGDTVSTSANFKFNLMSDTVLTANFEIKSFNVTLSANPAVGSNAVSGGGIKNCGKITVTATPDPCYAFTNWTDQNGAVVSTSANFTPTLMSDTVLTANFTIIPYNVNVSMNPTMGAGTVSGGGTFNCGDIITVTATPDPCYTFINWTEGGVVIPDTGASYTFTLGKHRTLVANFQQKTFTVTVTPDPPGWGTVSGNGSILCGSNRPIVATPGIFYNFINWTDLAGNIISPIANYTLKNVISDTTLIAHFEPKTYTINVSAASGGVASGGGTNIPYNTSWTVTATPNAPIYKFSHWEDYGSKVEGAPATYTFPVTGDRNLIAVFAKETVIIKVITEPDTGGMAYQSAYKVALDSLCFVWATPSICSHFTNWTTLDNTVRTDNDTLWFTVYPDYYSNIIDGVITFVAHFKLNTFEVTLEPSPPWGGDVYGEGLFACGTEIEVIADADPDIKYKFVEWVEVSGTDTIWGVSHDAAYKFNVIRPIKLVAIFELQKYQITVYPNPDSGGIAWGSGLFPYDTKDTVHARPYDEWTFLNWTENGIPVCPDEDYPFTVTRDRVLYANFIPKTFTVELEASPPHGGSVDSNGFNIPYGTLWDILATPNPAFEFSHWEENGIPCVNWGAAHTISVIRDFKLTAVFVLKQYEITLATNPPTGGTTTGGGTFEHGTSIEVEAFANSCHLFSHWTENGIQVCSTPLYPFTVTGPRHLVAHFTPEMHNITLIADPPGSGTLTGGGPQACLSEITVTATPDACYIFEGWFEAGSLLQTDTDYTFTVDAPRTLVAKFIQKLFDVTTALNTPGSGTTTGNEKDVPCGENRTVTAIPNKGYIFQYWTLNGIPVSANHPIFTFTVTETSNLIACFEYAEYKVTLLKNIFAGGQVWESGYYPHGDTITVHAKPNPCYTFVNWTEEDTVVSTNPDYTFILYAPRTLVANFDTAMLTITTAPDPDPEGGLTFPAYTSVTCGEWVTVTAAANPHFIFDHWTLNGNWASNAGTFSFPANDNFHAVAHFRLETCNVTVMADPTPPIGGTVSGGGYNLPYGSTIGIHAEPFPCYEFVNWTENGTIVSVKANDTITVTHSCTLVAHFTPKLFNLIVEANPGGYGHAIQNKFNIPCGTQDTVHAIANPGHVFVKWTEFGDTVTLSNEHDYPVVVTKHTHLIAHFEKENYIVHLEANPDYGGIVWKDDTVPFGTYFTAHAQENTPFFTFIKWTKDGNMVGSYRDYDFTVTESCTLVAHFEALTFDIDLTANPTEGGAVDGAGNYDYGEQITITADPAECYDFVGWFEADTLVSQNLQYTFMVDGYHHFYAHFEKQFFRITTEPHLGGGTTTPQDTTVECGEWITLTATPNLGYIFVGWTLADGTALPYNAVHLLEVKDSCKLIAHFMYQTYNITLEASPFHAGNVDTADYYPHGYNLTVHAKAKMGYQFVEWRENDITVHNTPDYSFEVDRARHLVAVFDTAYHRITTEANNAAYGITFPEDTLVIHGNPVTVTAVAKNNNLTFKYWTENGNPIYPANPSLSFTVLNDRKLIAVFEPKTFNVIVTRTPPEGGWVEGGGSYIPYLTDTSVTAHPYPNWNFTGWFEDDNLVWTPPDTVYPFTVERDRELEARFIPKCYEIRVFADPTGGGKAWGNPAPCISYNDTTTVHARPYDGYVFVGWYENGMPLNVTETDWNFKVTRPADLYAVFEPAKYSVLLEANPPDGGTVWDNGYNLDYGQEITVHAKENKYFKFIDWTWEDNSKASPYHDYTFNVTRACTLTANFEHITSRITLMANPPNGVTALIGAGDIPQGTEHAIIAEPAIGYRFIDWTENQTVVSTTQTHTFTVDEKEHTFVANLEFVACKITVTADPTEGGAITGNGLIPLNTIHTVTATPAECYSFVNWTENGITVATEPEYTFSVDKDRDLVAHFVKNNFTVTVSANPTGYGTATGGAANIICKEEISVTATPNTGYLFENWTKEGTVVATDPVYTFAVVESCELTANFVENIKTITLIANPTELGAVEGAGDYLDKTPITVRAIPGNGNSFINWTENGVPVSSEADYSFIVTNSRTLVANFEETYYNIIVIANDTLYGTATGSGKYKERETVQANAFVKQGYRFLNWTVNNIIVSLSNVYEFEATQNITLVANFYGLDFDTYAATLWDNTFMLDLKKLADEGYDITNCKWFKNAKEVTHTNTINQFSYSAGPKITDKLELAPAFYYFQLTTKNGSILYSTKKILTNYQYSMTPPKENLYVYPNPALSGNAFTVENAVPGTLMQVYNEYGVCVKSLTVNNEIVTLSLNLPAGVYLIKNDYKEAKVVITK